MICFGDYLKDYLEYSHISQSEFAMRLGISQKHMNELLNGKKSVTADMAFTLERLTGIDAAFILKTENDKKLSESIIDSFTDRQNARIQFYTNYCVKLLEENGWMTLHDETDEIQIGIDLLNFLKIRDFNVIGKLEQQILFKKGKTDFIKLALWIARSDQIADSQDVEEYSSSKLPELLKKLLEEANNTEIQKSRIGDILNQYGIFFACEKPLPDTNVNGCFKVKAKNPAIYIANKNSDKNTFFFELFHELGHCKSDYNEAQSKVIVEGRDAQEERADEYARNAMVPPKVWTEVLNSDQSISALQKIATKNKIPLCFIESRLEAI